MSYYAIRVSGVSKKYTIGAFQGRYKSLRDSLMAGLTAPFKRLAHPNDAAWSDRLIWALKDVSFNIEHGEVVGVIGRNGAGKSTLLKILSRITEPTEGEIRLRGRVGSLLEVGTGFHNELTGRENIFLNGAILGMSRLEIQRKFDEIVNFAEVEKFIDTPVKHYSSGMYLRLAFAVAAHLETEILLVDEVLAVGDAQFQKKCLGKMSQVANQGRTVLFVSHNLAAIKNLCRSGVVINAGKLEFAGPIEEALNRYLSSNDQVETGIVDLTGTPTRFGSGEMKLRKFWVEDESHTPVDALISGSCCRLAVEYESAERIQRRNVSMSIVINTLSGAPVTLINTHILDQHFEIAPEEGRIYFAIPKLPLTSGRYIVDLNLATYGGHTYADFIKGAAAFDVTDGDFYGTGKPGNPGAPVMFEGNWIIEDLKGKN